jgi:heme oxygenase
LDGQSLKALKSDLEWFGIAPIEAAVLTLPEDPNSALGALYVLEGSNLGGRIIGKNISAALGVGPGAGGSFYCGLTAEDARRRWKLLEEIFRLEIDEREIPCEPVTEAAVQTFASLETFMREQ